MSNIFDFDRTAVSLLRYIKHHPGKTASEIFQVKKFRDKIDSANTAVNISFYLENLYKQGYICNDPNLLLASLKTPCNSEEFMLKDESFYVTPMGNKFLEDHSKEVSKLIASIISYLFP